MEGYRQLSLFDLVGDHTKAVCLFDGQEVSATQPESWMKKLVPAGELVAMVGDHPLVLSPTPLTAKDVRPGHEFYHYLADGVVYSGIFIGKEVA